MRWSADFLTDVTDEGSASLRLALVVIVLAERELSASSIVALPICESSALVCHVYLFIRLME